VAQPAKRPARQPLAQQPRCSVWIESSETPAWRFYLITSAMASLSKYKANVRHGGGDNAADSRYKHRSREIGSFRDDARRCRICA
jgi:hypothetical protein